MNLDLTLRDPITGAYNRPVLLERLREEIERARRYSLSLSLLLLDLDRFPAIITTLGQSRGDGVMATFAQLVLAQIRSADLLFRYEENMLCLLLPSTDKQQATALAQRLQETVDSATFPGDPPLSFVLNIGLASIPDAGAPPEGLLERADRRLYKARGLGGGRVVAEDVSARPPLAFEVAAYLEERGPAYDGLRAFLAELPKRKRGLLNVHGPFGAGQSDFLAEIARESSDRGFLVLQICANPALRGRLYGALEESRASWPDLPDPLEEDAFILALQRLVARGKNGLMLVVDTLAELDRATIGLLRRLLYSSDIQVIALAYATGSDELSSSQRALLMQAPYQAEIDLQAFSRPGLGLWLRDVLQWDPPEAFVEWLYHETGGLPGNLRRALALLADRNLLRPTETGWSLGAGYRSLPTGQILSEHHEREIRPLLPAGDTSLPFVGRTTELHRTRQGIASSALVTITGPAGAGKTRLALQAALELRERFPGGVFLVQAASCGSDSELSEAAARALGLETGPQKPAREALQAFLSSQEEDLLLVINDVDGREMVSGLIDAIRLSAGHIHVLVTTRQALGLEGEQLVDLGPFPIPPEQITGELESYSAVQLFLLSARRSMAGFELHPADLPALRRIIRAVGAYPLGIEMAAAWAPLLSVPELLRGVEYCLSTRPLKPLTGPLDSIGAFNFAKGSYGLLAVLDCFWGLLSEDERRGLRALSVFPGDFDWAAARQLAGASLFFLDGLAAKAFLVRTGPRRYAFHELVRQDAARRLAAIPGEHAQVMQRFEELPKK